MKREPALSAFLALLLCNDAASEQGIFDPKTGNFWCGTGNSVVGMRSARRHRHCRSALLDFAALIFGGLGLKLCSEFGFS